MLQHSEDGGIITARCALAVTQPSTGKKVESTVIARENYLQLVGKKCEGENNYRTYPDPLGIPTTGQTHHVLDSVVYNLILGQNLDVGNI